MDLFFRLVAPFYDRLMGRDATDSIVRQILATGAVAGGGRVLDVGGGTGRIAAGLRVNGARVAVLDVSRHMLAQACKKSGLAPVQGSATHMPFPDGTFDLAVCVDAFHHLPQPEVVAVEIARVLRPGGKLFIQDYDVARLPVRLLAFGERAMMSKGRFFRPQDLKALLASGRLTLVAETRDGLAYTVVVEKRGAMPIGLPIIQ